MDPCGTLVAIDSHLELVLFISTYCVLFVR